MRVSQDSHEILMRKPHENFVSAFLMNVSCNSLDQEILVENVVS